MLVELNGIKTDHIMLIRYTTGVDIAKKCGVHRSLPVIGLFLFSTGGCRINPLHVIKMP